MEKIMHHPSSKPILCRLAPYICSPSPHMLILAQRHGSSTRENPWVVHNCFRWHASCHALSPTMLRSGGTGADVCMHKLYHVQNHQVVHNCFLPLYLAAGLIVMLMGTSGHGWVVTLNLTPEDAAGVSDIIPLYLLPQNNVRCAAATHRSGFYLVC